MEIDNMVLGPGQYGYPCKHGGRERTCEKCIKERSKEFLESIGQTLQKNRCKECDKISATVGASEYNLCEICESNYCRECKSKLSAMASNGLCSSCRKSKTRNYTADDDTYPTKITFDDGRVVMIKYENGRVYLDVETNG